MPIQFTLLCNTLVSTTSACLLLLFIVATTQAADVLPLDEKRRIVRNVIYAFEESNQVDRCRAILVLRKYHSKISQLKYSSDAQKSMIRLVRKANPSFPVADYCAYPHLVRRLDDIRTDMHDDWLQGDVTVLPGKIKFDDKNQQVIVSYKKFLRGPDGTVLQSTSNTAALDQENGIPLGKLLITASETLQSSRVASSLQTDSDWMRHYQTLHDMASSCISENDCRNQHKHYLIRAQDYYQKCRAQDSQNLCERGHLLFDLADITVDFY